VATVVLPFGAVLPNVLPPAAAAGVFPAEVAGFAPPAVDGWLAVVEGWLDVVVGWLDVVVGWLAVVVA